MSTVVAVAAATLAIVFASSAASKANRLSSWGQRLPLPTSGRAATALAAATVVVELCLAVSLLVAPGPVSGGFAIGFVVLASPVGMWMLARHGDCGCGALLGANSKGFLAVRNLGYVALAAVVAFGPRPSVIGTLTALVVIGLVWLLLAIITGAIIDARSVERAAESQQLNEVGRFQLPPLDSSREGSFEAVCRLEGLPAGQSETQFMLAVALDGSLSLTHRPDASSVPATLTLRYSSVKRWRGRPAGHLWRTGKVARAIISTDDPYALSEVLFRRFGTFVDCDEPVHVAPDVFALLDEQSIDAARVDA